MLHNTNLFLEEVNKQLKEGQKAELRTVTKNNGVEKTGIILITEGNPVAPTIYVDNFDEETVEDEVKKFFEIVENEVNKDLSIVPVALDEIENWEVRACAINRALNPNFSGPTLYITNEIQIVFRLHKDQMSILVDDDIVNKFPNLTKAYLYENAYKNNDYIVKSLREMISDLTGMDLPQEPDEFNILVITTEDGVYGAGLIGNKDLMETISLDYYDGKDFVIIPSSIHELLTFPCETELESRINSIICEVNENEVDETEILGTKAMRYNSESHKIYTIFE